MKNKTLSSLTSQKVDGSALNAKITISKAEKIAIDARKRKMMKIMKVNQSIWAKQSLQKSKKKLSKLRKRLLLSNKSKEN